MNLFKNEDGKPRRRKPGAVDTLIGAHTEIRGDVLFSGGLHVDGKIKGKVLAISGEEASLSIAEDALVEGDVSVPILTVNGSVSGNVFASEKMTLAHNARVHGNVYYNVLEVQSGAEVNGQLVHDPRGEHFPASGSAESRGADVRELRQPRAVS